MEKPMFSKKRVLLYVFIALLACHHFLFRPALLTWGAPERLQSLPLPGDSLTQGKHHTRAVLIDRTPAQLWPWLMQLGQERGGFYSYERLENLFRAEMKNVYELNPALQGPREAGDTVWLAGKNHYGGKGFQVIALIAPQHSYVMVSDQDYVALKSGKPASGSWAFYLQPENERQTWLIVRSSEGDITAREKLIRYVTFEVPHAIMEIKMLKTIRGLAEYSQRGDSSAGRK